MPALNTDNILDFLTEVIDRRGGESYLGEDVTQREHMLQSAHLAYSKGAGPELIAGALLHDIGHFTSEFPEDALEHGTDNFHQYAGARVLEPFFPKVVVDCVRHHVAAKRYLCAKRSTYMSSLSDASIDSLRLQGGPMSKEELHAFQRERNFDAIIAVRVWDDEAKVAGLTTAPFDFYRRLLESLLLKN